MNFSWSLDVLAFAARTDVEVRRPEALCLYLHRVQEIPDERFVPHVAHDPNRLQFCGNAHQAKSNTEYCEKYGAHFLPERSHKSIRYYTGRKEKNVYFGSG